MITYIAAQVIDDYVLYVFAHAALPFDCCHLVDLPFTGLVMELTIVRISVR